MNRPSMQAPTAEELALIEDVGLTPIAPSPAYDCLRWSASDPPGGILYASHMPLPWGAYFRFQGSVHFVWGTNIQSALVVLHLARR